MEVSVDYKIFDAD